MHLHGSAYEIASAGDVCLSFPSGASYTLRHVRYVPEITQSLISVRQLQDSGCQVFLGEQSFQMRCRSLVIARGDRSRLIYPLYVSEVRDDVVLIELLTCRQIETRRVSFAIELHHAQETEHLAVQGVSVVSVETEVERDCSSETQQGMEFSHMLMRDEHEVTVSHMLMRDEHKVTEVASMPLEPETDALFYDAFDAFEVDNDLLIAVHGLSAVELSDCRGRAALL